MKIEKIQTTQFNFAFQAGKVRVFSDFDRTFLPTSQKSFKQNQDKVYINKMKTYFKNFENFLKNTRKGLKFTITTGRRFEEFFQFAEIAREKNVKMPFPDTLIVQNGTHEHLRVGSDADFYKRGVFPFKDGVRNSEKEQKIKNMRNSDITKQVDAGDAVKRAVENNDLVIAAGDHHNDVELLNPGLYLKDFLTKEIINKYSNKDFTKTLENPEELIKLLDNDSNLADIFKKIPFVGIVVKHKSGENKLRELEPFTKGAHQKLILIEQGNLKEGIKKAIKLYNKQNPKFEKELSKDLRKQINSPSDGGDDGEHSKNKIWKSVLIVLSSLGICEGIYLWNKNKKNTKTQHTVI